MRKGGSFSPKWSRYIESPWRSGPPALLLLLRRFHAGVQRRAVDAEHFGRLTDIASRELHRRLDVALLPSLEHLVEIEAALALQVALRLLDERPRIRRQAGSSVALRFQIELGLELRDGQLLPGVLCSQPDDDVAQLAHVAREVIVAPGLLRRFVQGERRELGLLRVELAVMLEQQGAVLVHLAQRRYLDREHRQPVIQVGAEIPFPDFLAQVAVSGGNHPGTGETLLRLADALELAVLEHAQKLGLQLQGQLADLIEKQRSVARVFEIARFVLRRAGEGALGVAEQRRLDQGRRDRRAVERKPWLHAPPRKAMEQVRHHFLAGSRFALDERREGRVGVLVDLAFQLLQCRALADQRIGLDDPFPRDFSRAKLQGVQQDLFEILRIAGLGDELGGTERARVPRVGSVVLAR